MNPVARESKGRNKDNVQYGSRSLKGKTPMNGKKYLPSTAFNKTVKSSTTKSLLKFRERKEQQELRKAQQYKSYQRIMKREGYDINKNTGSQNRKRLRDENIEVNDAESSKNGNYDSETSILESETQTSFKETNSELSFYDSAVDSHSIIPNNQISATISTKELKHVKRSKDGVDDTQLSNCNDLQRKSMPSNKWTTKKNHQLLEQRRADEYKERQIKMERAKKDKLKQRQNRHRLLSARTSKGQPVMKNIALDILNKLQREQQHQQQDGSLKHR